ncbi:hypothetical protein JCM3765_007296 [Sporobolomyces pararoseus]
MSSRQLAPLDSSSSQSNPRRRSDSPTATTPTEPHLDQDQQLATQYEQHAYTFPLSSQQQTQLNCTGEAFSASASEVPQQKQRQHSVSKLTSTSTGSTESDGLNCGINLDGNGDQALKGRSFEYATEGSQSPRFERAETGIGGGRDFTRGGGPTRQLAQSNPSVPLRPVAEMVVFRGKVMADPDFRKNQILAQRKSNPKLNQVGSRPSTSSDNPSRSSKTRSKSFSHTCALYSLAERPPRRGSRAGSIHSPSSPFSNQSPKSPFPQSSPLPDVFDSYPITSNAEQARSPITLRRPVNAHPAAPEEDESEEEEEEESSKRADDALMTCTDLINPLSNVKIANGTANMDLDSEEESASVGPGAAPTSSSSRVFGSASKSASFASPSKSTFASQTPSRRMTTTISTLHTPPRTAMLQALKAPTPRQPSTGPTISTLYNKLIEEQPCFVTSTPVDPSIWLLEMVASRNAEVLKKHNVEPVERKLEIELVSFGNGSPLLTTMDNLRAASWQEWHDALGGVEVNTATPGHRSDLTGVVEQFFRGPEEQTRLSDFVGIPRRAPARSPSSPLSTSPVRPTRRTSIGPSSNLDSPPVSPTPNRVRFVSKVCDSSRSPTHSPSRPESAAPLPSSDNSNINPQYVPITHQAEANAESDHSDQNDQRDEREQKRVRRWFPLQEVDGVERQQWREVWVQQLPKPSTEMEVEEQMEEWSTREYYSEEEAETVYRALIEKNKELLYHHHEFPSLEIFKLHLPHLPKWLVDGEQPCWRSPVDRAVSEAPDFKIYRYIYYWFFELPIGEAKDLLEELNKEKWAGAAHRTSVREIS